MSQTVGDFAPWLGAFETLRVIKGKPLFVPEHLAELRRGLDALGVATDFDPMPLARDLPQKTGRWRWIVTATEARTLFTPEEPPVMESMEIAVSPVRLGSANWDARFKTISHLAHAQAWKIATTPDVVLLNEKEEVASTARGNIFWRRKGRLFTPAHEAGCRCGVVRGFMLAREDVSVGRFPLEDLLAADEVFMTNSVRGIVSVNCMQGNAVPSSESAARLRNAYDKEVARQAA